MIIHNQMENVNDFYDPLLAGERGAGDGNYNKNEDRTIWK